MGGTLGPVPSGLHKDKAVEWIVFGYYPYWVHDMSEFQWDLLTHVAWFAIEIGSDGTATSTHGWPDQTVLDAAHASETKAHLSFTLFSQSGIAASTYHRLKQHLGLSSPTRVFDLYQMLEDKRRPTGRGQTST